MEYTRLGTTELRISRLALGCEPQGGADWGEVDLEQAKQAVRHAWDRGITTFDVADVYGLGRAEETLARALGDARHDAVIISKGGVAWQEAAGGARARTYRDGSPARMVAALEDSLRRMKLECLPVYLIHWPDGKTPIEETVQALDACRRAGKFRHLGLSNFTPSEIRRAQAVAPIAVVEAPYNLIDRQAEAELLPAMQEVGVGVMAYGPLAQGLLAGKYGPETTFPANDRRHRLPHFREDAWPANLRLLKRMAETARAHGKTLPEVALRWVLDHPAVSCVIAGAKSPVQVDGNLGALGWWLSEREREFLSG
jgi:aryl-alcohol dehydrogenase-like predicted oxidoreductase